MSLTQDEVRHVAELAKLRLTDEEIQTYTEQLSAILEYAERIQEVDTGGANGPVQVILSVTGKFFIPSSNCRV